MKRLFTANLARLCKSRLFYGCAAAVALLMAWNYWVSYSDMAAGYYMESLESRAFGPVPFAVLLIAVFCCLFIGDEFGFGTIRNKLTAGYRRWQVFFAMLLTGMAAGLFFLLVYFLVTLTLGVWLLGSFAHSPKWILYCAFCLLLIVWCSCAIMTALAMLIFNRAVSVTAGILLALGLIVSAAMLENRLSEPEIIDRYILIDDHGKPMEVESQPNPGYLSGSARQICQWLLDIHPIGQAIQISNISGEHPERWPFCSAGVFVLVCGAGIWMFGRRDIS